MSDIATRYLGLELPSPIVASASPRNNDVDHLLELERAGAGAVVLPSLFEEQLVEDSLHLDRLLDAGMEASAEATGGWLPELATYNTGPDRYLALVAEARRRLTIPVIASLNGVTPGGWVHHAALLEGAGASAIELNLYDVVADARADAAGVEAAYEEVVAGVRAEVSVPLAVKVSPYFTSLAHTVTALVEAGADGVVLFNRFFEPDIDLDTLEVVPRLQLGTPSDSPLVLRWVALLRGAGIQASIAGSGGVHGGDDALKLLLAGADVAMTTSAVLRHGAGRITEILGGMRRWMRDNEYTGVDQLRGALRHRPGADTAYTRAGYVRSLTSFASA